MTNTVPLKNICVLGNIGSGKSTLTRFLASAIPNSIAIPEVFDTNPFLARYAVDPPRWAFTNAVRYFYDYARVFHELTEGHTYAHHFIDAGGTTNRYIYGRYLLNEMLVTPEENAFYETLTGVFQAVFAYPEPDGYIFLNATPQVCFERMKARGWKYQTENMGLDYLVGLERYFRELRDSLFNRRVPLLELDSGTLDFTKERGRTDTLARIEPFRLANEVRTAAAAALRRQAAGGTVRRASRARLCLSHGRRCHRHDDGDGECRANHARL
jgi:deoxyadenosine/deoxycytidine kinase